MSDKARFCNHVEGTKVCLAESLANCSSPLWLDYANNVYETVLDMKLEDKCNMTCHYNPCRNGGECVPEGYGYQCQCLPGFYGDDCQLGEWMVSISEKNTWPNIIYYNTVISAGLNNIFNLLRDSEVDIYKDYHILLASERSKISVLIINDNDYNC